MSGTERLKKLQKMAGMVLDLRAASLAKAAAARDGVKEKLAALDRPATVETMGDMTEAQRFLVYEGWAAGRRAKLNQQLARQEVIWRNELTLAREAFGREQVLAKLQQNRPKR